MQAAVSQVSVAGDPPEPPRTPGNAENAGMVRGGAPSASSGVLRSYRWSRETAWLADVQSRNKGKIVAISGRDRLDCQDPALEASAVGQLAAPDGVRQRIFPARDAEEDFLPPLPLAKTGLLATTGHQHTEQGWSRKITQPTSPFTRYSAPTLLGLLRRVC